MTEAESPVFLVNDESFADLECLNNSGSPAVDSSPVSLTTNVLPEQEHFMAEQHTTVNAHNFQDLTGRVFGKLRVLKRDRRDSKKKAFWVCVCECGRERTVEAYYLTNGRTTDCGCLRGENWKEAMRRFHEQHGQPTSIAISLSNGMAVIIDEDDYSVVSQFWWSAHRGTNTTYARASSDNGRILMHVLIMGSKEGHTVDHINGNGLDNRRCNLRFATGSEQCRNTHGGRGRSLYKGVSWAVRHHKWTVCIHIDGRNKFLGYFDQEDDAARAYDTVAIEHFGEFAQLNFPPNQDGAS